MVKILLSCKIKLKTHLALRNTIAAAATGKMKALATPANCVLLDINKYDFIIQWNTDCSERAVGAFMTCQIP